MSSVGATIAKAAAECALTSAWQGTLLVGAMMLVLQPLRGMSAKARFFMWGAVCVLVLAMPLGQFVLPARVGGSAGATPILALPMFVAWGFLGLWAGLSLVRAVQLVRSARHIRMVCREAQPLTLEQRREFDFSDETLDRIAISELVGVPCVAGFLEPRVLLPVGLIEAMSSAELIQVVRHELEHVRRRDPWLNLLQKFLLMAFPLNPALWWAERRLCAERELACDDQVLAETGAARDYALSLTNLAELSMARRSAMLMLGAWRKRSELSLRVQRILSVQRRWKQASTVALTALLTLAAGGGGFVLSRTPSWVSFANPMPTRVPPLLAAKIDLPAVQPVVSVATPPTAKKRIAKQRKSAVPSDASLPIVAQELEPLKLSPHVALAAYTKPKDKTAHVQPVLLDDGEHTYAAFHLADGWIFIQL